VAPGFDVANTIFQALRIVWAGAAEEEDYRGATFSRAADLTFGVAFGALALTSAIYGFTATSKCRLVLGMEAENADSRRARPHLGPPTRNVAEELAEEEAVQARAAALTAAQAKAAGEAAQRSMPTSKGPGNDAPSSPRSRPGTRP
jgi:hypothetical protein